MNKNHVFQVSDGSAFIVENVVVCNRPWSVQIVWSGLDAAIKVTPKHSNDGGNFNSLPLGGVMNTGGTAAGTLSMDGMGITHKDFKIELDVLTATTGIVIVYYNLPDRSKGTF